MINNKYLSSISKIFSMEIFAKAIFSVISLGVIRFLSEKEFATYIISLTTISIITSSIGAIFNRLFIAGKFNFEKYSFLPFLGIQGLLIVFLFFLFLPLKEIYEGNLGLVFLVSSLQIFFIFIQTSFQKELNFFSYYSSEYIRLCIYLISFILLAVNDLLSTKNILIVQSGSVAIASMLFVSKLKIKNESFLFQKIFSLLQKIFLGSNKYLIFYSLIVVFMSGLDTLLLRIFDDKNQVAIFGAAFTYYGILQSILYAVNKLYLPMIQKTKSLEEINLAMTTLNALNIKYLSILFVLAIALSPAIIPLIDNGRYPDSILIFQILATSSFFSLLFSPYKNILFKFSDNKYIFSLYLKSFILIYIFLLPNVIIKYHSIGVAIVFLINWFIVNYISFLRAKKILKIIDKFGWKSMSFKS